MSGENRVGLVVVKAYQGLRSLLGDRKVPLEVEKVKQTSLIQSQGPFPWRSGYDTIITLWTCFLAQNLSGFMSGSNEAEKRISKNGKS